MLLYKKRSFRRGTRSKIQVSSSLKARSVESVGSSQIEAPELVNANESVKQAAKQSYKPRIYKKIGLDGRVKINLSNKGVKFNSEVGAIDHFNSHAKEIMNLTNRTSYNLKQYLSEANHIIKTGAYVPERNAFIKFMGTYGNEARYGFVGLDRITGNITTFHVKSVLWLSKHAPSTGFLK